MRGQVGYWSKEGLTVGFDREMAAWLDGHRGRAELLSGRRVWVHKGLNGVHLSNKGGGHRSELFLQPTETRPTPCGDMARFGLTFVDFRYVNNQVIEATLPDDHELEWPLLRECAEYDCALVAEEVLLARMLSLVAGGQTTFPPAHRPPDAFRRLLPDGAWKRCLDTARALSGVK